MGAGNAVEPGAPKRGYVERSANVYGALRGGSRDTRAKRSSFWHIGRYLHECRGEVPSCADTSRTSTTMGHIVASPVVERRKGGRSWICHSPPPKTPPFGSPMGGQGREGFRGEASSRARRSGGARLS